MERTSLEKCANLEELLLTVSSLASSLPTQFELDQSIKEWRLSTSSIDSIQKSFVNLVNMIGARNKDLTTPELFRLCVGRVLLEDLSEETKLELISVRSKIRNDDNLNDLLSFVLSSLYNLISCTSDKEPQIHAIQDAGYELHTTKPRQSDQYQVNTPTTQTDEYSSGSEEGSSDSEFSSGSKAPKKRIKCAFVSPWPIAKPYKYTNAEGTFLTDDFKNWFQSNCYKCGLHSSHIASQCRTYPDRDLNFNLCTICRQGLHSHCKNRVSHRAKEENRKRDNLEEIQKKLNEMKDIFTQWRDAPQPSFSPCAMPQVIPSCKDDHT
jgi:hypothetical protein